MRRILWQEKLMRKTASASETFPALCQCRSIISKQRFLLGFWITGGDCLIKKGYSDLSFLSASRDAAWGWRQRRARLLSSGSIRPPELGARPGFCHHARDCSLWRQNSVGHSVLKISSTQLWLQSCYCKTFFSLPCDTVCTSVPRQSSDTLWFICKSILVSV